MSRRTRGGPIWKTKRSLICTLPAKSGPLPRPAKNTAATAAPSPSTSCAATRIRRNASATRGCTPGTPSRPRGPAVCAHLSGASRAICPLRAGRQPARRSAAAGQTEILLSELADCLPGGERVDARLDAQAVTLTIEAYLRTQTRENRQLFVRRYYYGDSVRRLSGLFGLTENTVKSRLFRLRAGLRDALLKEGIAV